MGQHQNNIASTFVVSIDELTATEPFKTLRHPLFIDEFTVSEPFKTLRHPLFKDELTVNPLRPSPHGILLIKLINEKRYNPS